jgi:lysozyme
VYIRASEGQHIQDKHFARNWAMARACGLPRGSYHVFEPTQDVDKQVAHFLGILGDDHGELPAVLDIEITPEMVATRNQRNKTKDVFPSRAVYMKAVLTWLSKVEAATGMRPMVYIQPWYWQSYLGKSAELVEHRLWAAGAAPRAKDAWPWTLWQHGQPAHWDARVWDRDMFHGSPAELDALLKSKAIKK